MVGLDVVQMDRKAFFSWKKGLCFDPGQCARESSKSHPASGPQPMNISILYSTRSENGELRPMKLLTLFDVFGRVALAVQQLRIEPIRQREGRKTTPG